MKNQTKVKCIRLKVNMINIIEEMAKKENRNFSNMVETLLIRAFEKNEKVINYKISEMETYTNEELVRIQNHLNFEVGQMKRILKERENE